MTRTTMVANLIVLFQYGSDVVSYFFSREDPGSHYPDDELTLLFIGGVITSREDGERRVSGTREQNGSSSRPVIHHEMFSPTKVCLYISPPPPVWDAIHHRVIPTMYRHAFLNSSHLVKIVFFGLFYIYTQRSRGITKGIILKLIDAFYHHTIIADEPSLKFIQINNNYCFVNYFY